MNFILESGSAVGRHALTPPSATANPTHPPAPTSLTPPHPPALPHVTHPNPLAGHHSYRRPTPCHVRTSLASCLPIGDVADPFPLPASRPLATLAAQAALPALAQRTAQ